MTITEMLFHNVDITKIGLSSLKKKKKSGVHTEYKHGEQSLA